MPNDDYTPFEGKSRQIHETTATRVIRRFHRPAHVAEIRERRVTQFEAIEWMLFVDDSLIESRMYHGARLPNYAPELEECCQMLRRRHYIEDPTARPVAQ